MDDGTELQWLIGSMFLMGFDGTVVTAQIRRLIEEFHIGTVFLSAKNLSSAGQATELIRSLQEIAHASGYEYPLLIVIDQENGGVNSIFDSTYIRQFPSAMGIVASASLEMARAVATATAKELSCIGINWITGPALDVLSNTRTQPLGVRSLGDDPKEVARFGLQLLEGYHDAGIATCGKHFPSYGNLEVLGSPSDLPTISETIEQLKLSAFIPFEAAINNGLDAMMVGACAMPNVVGADITYASLSETIITKLLRQELGFEGVIMSECLEIESLYNSLGVGQATIKGVCAGCDVFLVCNSLANQLDAMSGLRAGVESGLVPRAKLETSSARVNQLRKRFTNWDKALNPEGTVGLDRLRVEHEQLSNWGYESSISVARDQGGFIPLSTKVSSQQELLLLTPLVEPFPGTDSTAVSVDSMKSSTMNTETEEKNYLKGETTFRQLGLSLAQRWPGKVLHTSYTASGIRPLHEDLISNAAAVVVLTADGVRNVYQYGFTKYVSTLCKTQLTPQTPNGKPCIVVAVSSPFDFLKDMQVGTYICTYDFTPIALDCLVRTLFGDLKPSGVAPGMDIRAKRAQANQNKTKSQQTWLVEDFDERRDLQSLQKLLDTCRLISAGSSNSPGLDYLTSNVDARWFLKADKPLVESRHFIIRNGSTKVLYGFCATYIVKSIGRGSIGLLLVDPQHRRMGIGHWLHQRALKHFAGLGVKDVQFGSDLPSLAPGVPIQPRSWSLTLQKWIQEHGWSDSYQDRMVVLEVGPLASWSPSPSLKAEVAATGSTFKVLKQANEDILPHVLESLAVASAHKNTLMHPQVVMQLYECALQDPQECSIITTQNSLTDDITGSAILYTSHSKLANYIPTGDKHTGGITGAMASPGLHAATLIEGLLAIGVSQFQARGFRTVRLHQYETMLTASKVDQHPASRVLERIGFRTTKEYFIVISETAQFGQQANTQ